MNKILSLFVLTAFSAAADVTPRMFRTTLERGFREVESVPFTPHTGGGARVIDLDAAKPSHPFVGLGGHAGGCGWWRVHVHSRQDTSKGAGNTFFSREESTFACVEIL